MKLSDKIFGFYIYLIVTSSISKPSKDDLIRQTLDKVPFCNIIKSLTDPFDITISSGWQILLEITSASLYKLFFDKLFRNPILSNNVLLAYFRNSISRFLGKDFNTSSCSSY